MQEYIETILTVIILAAAVTNTWILFKKAYLKYWFFFGNSCLIAAGYSQICHDRSWFFTFFHYQYFFAFMYLIISILFLSVIILLSKTINRRDTFLYTSKFTIIFTIIMICMGLTIYQICNIDKDLEPQAVMPNPNISNDDLHKTINQFRELIKSLRKSTYTFTYNDDPVSREEFFKYIDYRFAAPYAILMDKKMLARYLAGESHFSSKKRGLNYYVILPNQKIRLDKWLLSKIESKQKKRIIIISFLSVSPGSSR